MLSHFSHVQLFVTPQTVGTRLFCLWDSPGKNTGAGCPFLQGIFLTQGLNSWLFASLGCRQILYPLSHLGSPLNIMLAPKKYILVAMHCQLLLLILK